MRPFANLKVGDTVTRMLAGTVAMEMKVIKLDEKLIYCGATRPGAPPVTADDCWTFDRETGVEEDDLLKWGVKYGATGSYLVHPGVRMRDDGKMEVREAVHLDDDGSMGGSALAEIIDAAIEVAATVQSWDGDGGSFSGGGATDSWDSSSSGSDP
jgi:uncharacterized membrane protein YgcG